MNLEETNILLIGFMGTGKTTVSKELAKKTQMPEIDMDRYIVEYENMSIADIFSQKGEPYFRNLETECLKKILKTKNQIISCGGGVAMKEENVTHMKEGGVTILLSATPETVYERVKDNSERPILNGNMNVEYISGLMNARKPKYEAAADLVIDTDGKKVSDIADEIIKKIQEFGKKVEK